MFKIGLSLVLAVMAAFVIILAGFLSEVRIGTMLLRGVIGFVVAGFVVAVGFVVFDDVATGPILASFTSWSISALS